MDQKKDQKKIVITGGHAATMAISVVEEIIRRSEKGKFHSIYWIGSPRAIEGSNIPTSESLVLPKLGVVYVPITAGRVQIKFSRWTIPSLVKIPVGFVQAFLALMKIKPDVILSFGGFSAFPVVVAGFLMRVPIVIHEQTAVVGRANKYSSFLATKIALARESSRKYFPEKKCVLTGNPLITQITEIDCKKKVGEIPTIYIFGGSRGSQILNKSVEEILPELLKKYYILHNTGRLDYKKFVNFKKGLSDKIKNRYEVFPFADPMKIDNLYRQADLLISRAGAATISEIMATKRPAVVVPIPWSYMDEQTENARSVEKLGLVRVLKQNNLSGEKIQAELEYLVANYRQIAERMAKVVSPDILASKKLVDLMEETI